MREDFEPFVNEIKRGLMADAQPPAEAPPTLTTISATDLQQKNIPPIRWIVKDLIPAGLSILASSPKLGKSWMSLALCLSVAAGWRFLGYQCHKAGTLYLALEDSERRLKSRMNKLLAGTTAPAGFHLATTAPTISTGLIDALEGHIKQCPDTGLIVIDTLQKVRDMGGSDVYGKDYQDVGTLKRFADAHNVALLLIHHLRKMGDVSDPFTRISGTNGLSGAADTMMVLAKETRDAETATLSITGRDVEQHDLVLTFVKETCAWKNLGDAGAFAEWQAHAEYMDSPIVRTVKKLLEQSLDGTWNGSVQQLLEAGQFIARTSLADSTRALTSKLKELDKLLMEYDGIAHERKPNGSGGGKHKFYYVDAPGFEALPQTEIDPFSEG